MADKGVRYILGACMVDCAKKADVRGSVHHEVHPGFGKSIAFTSELQAGTRKLREQCPKHLGCRAPAVVLEILSKVCVCVQQDAPAVSITDDLLYCCEKTAHSTESTRTDEREHRGNDSSDHCSHNEFLRTASTHMPRAE